MPESYRPPIRRDKQKDRTFSQSSQTNVSADRATVDKILGQKGENVFSIGPDETLGRAVEVLRDRRIGALLVTDEAGALVGILSERDIVRKLADTPGQTLPQLVKDVMTSNVQTCSRSDTLISVLKQMTDGRFRHVPVVDGEKLIGMVTIGDVVNFRLTELEHERVQLKQLIVG
ncbi:MAG: CBS domain-containing protein [Pseudomonadota bacterium]